MKPVSLLLICVGAAIAAPAPSTSSEEVDLSEPSALDASEGQECDATSAAGCYNDEKPTYRPPHPPIGGGTGREFIRQYTPKGSYPKIYPTYKLPQPSQEGGNGRKPFDPYTPKGSSNKIYPTYELPKPAQEGENGRNPIGQYMPKESYNTIKPTYKRISQQESELFDTDRTFKKARRSKLRGGE